MTQHVNEIKPPAKFQNYWPLSLQDMALTQLYYSPDKTFCQGQITQNSEGQKLSSLLTAHLISELYLPMKFHDYLPYSLGVIAWTPFSDKGR